MADRGDYAYFGGDVVAGGQAGGGGFVIRSFVHEGVAYLEVTGTFLNVGGVSVDSFDLSGAGGAPLPSWIWVTSQNLVILKPPAGMQYITLEATARYTDGSERTVAVRLDLVSGELSETGESQHNDNSASATPLYDRMAELAMASRQETARLMQALNAI
jgi:hypothetical protein